MDNTRLRYMAKQFSKGKYGVYDWTRGSYPVQTPELRAAGIDRLEQDMTADQAESIADLLNGIGKSAKKASGAFEDMAAALIADQKEATVAA